MSEKPTSASSSTSKLNAVVFDYGEVLCHRPSPEEFLRMANIFGLTLESFLPIWDRSRALVDSGRLTPEAYWAKFAEDTKTTTTPEQVQALCRWEIEMWSNENPTMIAWLHDLSAAGIKIGLLSNMPRDLAAHVQKAMPWMRKFDFKTFSAHVSMLKPDPAIYEHTLRGLGVQATETIFIDDREPNIEAARGVGMQAIRFISVEQLRNDLERLAFPVLPNPS
jgi:haloacid dehalogenase superfamily, subfamily IA, variant 3 with third motif having DD or ED/haloacid dehalogenase superfamily, subfamily IA, variant 1 with third motif having Dx(3-4)D or Dx(3-4)E